MFGTIRKHQTWLWAVIITVIVISFVIYFSPYSQLNSGYQAVDLGSIDGEPVTQLDYIHAQREADLHSFFTTGRWLDEDRRQSPAEIDRQIYQWLVLVNREEKLGIRVPDKVAEAAAWRLIQPFERMGITSPQVLIQQVLPQRGLTVADFERFLKHFVGIQELIATAGLTGKLVTPLEAKMFYEREHQEVSTAAVFFSASNYLASVTIPPDALSQYYSNRLALYAIPERLQVNYVRFSVTNFLAEAEKQLTNLTQLVDLNMQQVGTNFTRLGKTQEEARAKMREEILRTQAMTLARRKGLEFANDALSVTNPTPQTLVELANAKGIPVGVTAPFDRAEGPNDIEVGADFVKKAFGLTAEDPVGGPIMGEDGAYVFTVNKFIPREIPPLEQVREKVEADYKRSQSLLLAQNASQNAYKALTNSLAQGKTFDAAATEAGLKPVALPPFSLSTRSLPEVDDRISLDQLKQSAFGLSPGEVSPPVRISDGTMLVYLKARLPIDQAKMGKDLPAYTETVRRTRQQEAFNAWFSKEFTKEIRDGLRNTAFVQPQTQPPPAMDGEKAAKS